MSQAYDNPDLMDEIPEDLPEVIDLDEVVVNRRKFRLHGTVYEMEDRKDLSFVEAERVQRLLVNYRRIRAEDGAGEGGLLDADQEQRMNTVQRELLKSVVVGITDEAIDKANDRQINAITTLFFADWNNRAVQLEELIGPRSKKIQSESTPASSDSTRKRKPDSSSDTAEASSTGDK